MTNGLDEAAVKELVAAYLSAKTAAARSKALRKLVKLLPDREEQKLLADYLFSDVLSADEQRFALGRRLLRPMRINLYEVGRLLREPLREVLGVYLEGVYAYLQDPLVAQVDPRVGVRPVEVRWEPGLADGPTSARLAVVDYNGDTGVLVPPAKWHAEKRQFQSPDGGPVSLKQSGVMQFHQVNAWAVVQRAIDLYEAPAALARPIPWGTGGNRLIIVPHAGYGANAYYDRHSKSLQFYYYGSPDDPKYTCLSHDIVAHEAGHAILDGIRPLYYDFTSVQTAAFHEFVADLTAILVALRNNDVRRAVKDKTQGRLDRDNAIASLAEELGEHLNGIAKLRDANNNLDMEEIQGNRSPHDCSLVLTGAMYEILVEIARNYIEEERAGGEPAEEDEEPGDEETLKMDKAPSPGQALWWGSQRIDRMALQPLDFCPPGDIRFVDYARAVIRSFELYEPLESPRRNFYRRLLHDVFHRRLLCPRPAEACWADRSGCELYRSQPGRRWEWEVFPGIEAVSASRTAAYLFLHDNRRKLHIPNYQDVEVLDLYNTGKLGGEGRRLPMETVITYGWRETFVLDGPEFGRLRGQRAALWCGGTLVLDRRGNLLWWAHKPGTEWEKEPAKSKQDRAAKEKDGAEGRQRMAEYREQLARLVADGKIGLRGDTDVEILGGWTPPVVADTASGLLRLEIAPQMRDELYGEEGGAEAARRPSRGREGESDWDRSGERWTTSF